MPPVIRTVPSWEGIVTAIVVGAVSVGFAVAGDSEDRRLMTEAPKAMEQYWAFLKNLQGTSQIKMTVDGKVTIDSEAKVLQKPDCALFLRQGHDGPQGDISRRGLLWACNRSYAFTLRRAGSDGPWRITSTTLRDEQDPAIHPHQEMAVKSLKWMHVLAGGAFLSDLLAHPTFRVVRSEEVTEQDAPCLRFHFESVHPLESKPFFPIQRGSMTLDPKRSWCVRRGEVECLYAGGSSKVTFRTELRDSPSGFPIPVSRTEDGIDREGTRTQTSRRIDSFQFEERPSWPDDSEFTLSAFGFPEPPGITLPATRRAVPIWLWVAIGGGALLVLAVGAAWLKSLVAARS